MRGKTPKTLVPDKVKNRKRWNFWRRAITIGAIVVVIFQLYQVNKSLSRLNDGNTNQLELLQQDINDVRGFLSLPIRTTGDEIQEEETLESSLFGMLASYKENLESEASQTKMEESLKAVLEGPALENLLNNSELKLILANPGLNQYEIKSGEIAVVEFGIQDGIMYVNVPRTSLKTTSDNFEQTLYSYLNTSSIKELLEAQKVVEERLSEITALRFVPEISVKLDEKKLRLMDPELTVYANGVYEAGLKKPDDTVGAGVMYNPTKDVFYITDQDGAKVGDEYQSIAELQSQLVSYLTNNSFPTMLERDVLESARHLGDLINSGSFKAALEDSGLTVSDRAETEQFYTYEFKEGDTVVMSILIDRTTGEILSEIRGERSVLSSTPIVNLESPEIQKKNGRVNFLVAGKHGSLTDTIIVASVNEATQKITLVSLPRDLYIDGAKVNSVYATKGGMPALVRKVEEVSGMKIKNYVLIDMYAFIDVVDYIGGIDVTLDQPLIDPSYKTFDNGKWGTLYYEAGTHHLNGKQALRIARSRHYSSDFDRAKRQHKILYALVEKGKKLSIKDAGTLMQIAITLMNKTETDMSAREGVNNFLRYKNYEIAGQYVLSTGNVLTSTYTGKLNSEDGTCEEECGAYILIPKDNDWRSIKSYFYNATRG